MRWRLVWQNVADLVDPPAAGRKEMKALTASEVRTFLEAAKGERLEGLLVLAVTSGWRGELLALRWQDIDPEAGSLRVVGSLGRARAAGLAVTNPKPRALDAAWS